MLSFSPDKISTNFKNTKHKHHFFLSISVLGFRCSIVMLWQSKYSTSLRPWRLSSSSSGMRMFEAPSSSSSSSSSPPSSSSSPLPPSSSSSSWYGVWMFEGKVHLLAGFYLRSEHTLQSAFGAGILFFSWYHSTRSVVSTSSGFWVFIALASTGIASFVSYWCFYLCGHNSPLYIALQVRSTGSTLHTFKVLYTAFWIASS